MFEIKCNNQKFIYLFFFSQQSWAFQGVAKGFLAKIKVDVMQPPKKLIQQKFSLRARELKLGLS